MHSIKIFHWPDGDIKGNIWIRLFAARVVLVFLFGGHGHHLPLDVFVEVRYVYSLLQGFKFPKTLRLSPQVLQVHLAQENVITNQWTTEINVEKLYEWKKVDDTNIRWEPASDFYIAT